MPAAAEEICAEGARHPMRVWLKLRESRTEIAQTRTIKTEHEAGPGCSWLARHSGEVHVTVEVNMAGARQDPDVSPGQGTSGGSGLVEVPPGKNVRGTEM